MKQTNVLCACLKKQAASNSPSGLLPTDPFYGSVFFA
jgi:hypothetical protein